MLDERHIQTHCRVCIRLKYSESPAAKQYRSMREKKKGGPAEVMPILLVQ